MLVGLDEEKNELVDGIIDFMRQYDILEQMGGLGKVYLWLSEVKHQPLSSLHCIKIDPSMQWKDIS